MAGEEGSWCADCFLQRTWKLRICACVIGRDSIHGGCDIVIIARTDALAVEEYEAALERVSSICGRICIKCGMLRSHSSLQPASAARTWASSRPSRQKSRLRMPSSCLRRCQYVPYFPQGNESADNASS
jgi:hypothetical protein